jgi:hypothetical protein
MDLNFIKYNIFILKKHNLIESFMTLCIQLLNSMRI